MQEDDLIQQIEALQKQDRKNKREIQQLRGTLELERQVATAKANQQTTRTSEQRDREKYMKLLLENCPDSILLLDKTNRLIYCTEFFLKNFQTINTDLIYGHTFQEVFNLIVDSQWVEAIYLKLKEVVNSNTPIKFEDTRIAEDGTPLKYIIQINPMVNSEGENEGAMMLFHDITEIERAREEAVIARDEAERASAAKGAFLANMSHEMRTPMNAIIGMTAIAKKSQELDKKNYCLKKIEDASNHLLGVINDILDMSKIEANKLELSFDSFNFEKMLQKVVNVINFKVDEKHQEFAVHIDDKIPKTLISDDQRLAQVIANLLSNAVKFTPERGSVILNACLEKQEGKIFTVRISVTDTGIGISEEQQKKLFSSFQQADGSTSRKFGGTGLGLAISKRIVEMMGGRIWIDSEEGKGSTFSFIIETEKGTDELHSLLAEGVNFHNLRILVVDDTPDICEYFKDLVSHHHIACDTAPGGEEACSLIEKNGFYDIYFVDWKMPGMDGVALSRWIREHESAGASVPPKSVVIMISAADWNSIEKEAKDVGVNKFLPKPLFQSNIMDCIVECLGKESIIAAERADQDLSAEDHFEDYHMLLAEDVEINREIVITLLEPTGLKIDCAENGSKALEMFRSDPDKYQLIFMDVQMPEMDGYEATSKIRAFEAERFEGLEFASQTPQKKLTPVPIIAMTANVFREDVERCLASGMNDHVGKPLDINEVLDKLRSYLRK
ncbi:response regulator [Leadbettera azotonutricia]|uniref:histidine kinase n=1 Tax=Leadbettera azotonutricia (strain ATCC BAA-888 / DSM 13862 / ZAS-9) TaxID=545695 RepID=F5YA19_LEAAZ|nr:response regulator [Leadbettera azotonutricia]AEF80296.1 sensory transduction histidine kinase [Leadbettera azotonutricia ZAS-9]